MKDKAQALALELKLLELDTENERLKEELDKHQSEFFETRKKWILSGVILFFVSFFITIALISLLLVGLSLALIFLGLNSESKAKREKIKEDIKKNYANTREVKKSLLHLKYEE